MAEFTRGDIRGYFQPAFLVCVVVLVLTGAGMSMRGLVAVTKIPLPLRKSLKLLDENGLEGYEVLAKDSIESDVVDELGTEDYIQWRLEDKNEPIDSPTRRMMLFITYYNLPDRVPHVPEECYTGGGYERRGSDGVDLTINNADGFARKLPATCLVFRKMGADTLHSRQAFPVIYFFSVDGEYAGSRNQARLSLNKSLFRKRSYFCKVELVFNQTAATVEQAQAVEASEKLLKVVLPILEREHWPKIGELSKEEDATPGPARGE